MSLRERFFLHKVIEDVGQDFLRHALAAIAHPQHGLTVLHRAAELDPPAGRRELGGVVQQVGHHLAQAHAVGDDVNAGLRHRSGDRVIIGRKQAAAAFQRGVDYAAQRNALLTQHYFAAGETFDIEQIVDQPHQVVKLPLHRAARHLDRASASPSAAPSNSRLLSITASGLRSSWASVARN